MSRVPTEVDMAEQALRLRSLGVDTRPAFAACEACAMPSACAGVRSCAIAHRQETRPACAWHRLIRGVRVEGDAVIVAVKGGSEAARFVCGEILREKEGGRS